MNRLTKRILTFALAILLAMQPCTGVTAAPQQTAGETAQTIQEEDSKAAEETVQTTQEETVQETEEPTQTTEEETASATEEITTQTSEEETETTQEITTETMETTEAESLVSALEVSPNAGTQKKITVSTFSELQKAFRTVSDRVITLGEDITANDPQMVNSKDCAYILCTKKNNVLDLNGHRIYVVYGDVSDLFAVRANANLIIRDTSESKSGECIVKNTRTLSGGDIVSVQGGTFTLEGGTITGKGNVGVAISNKKGTVEIQDGMVSNEKHQAIGSGDNLLISGGTIKTEAPQSYYAIYVSAQAENSMEFSLSGGTIISAGSMIMDTYNLGNLADHVPVYCEAKLNGSDCLSLLYSQYLGGAEGGNTLVITSHKDDPSYKLGTVTMTSPDSIEGKTPKTLTMEASDCVIEESTWSVLDKEYGWITQIEDTATLHDTEAYSVKFKLRPNGRFLGKTVDSVTMNGKELTDYEISGDYLYVKYFFTTSDVIGDLSLHISPPIVGKTKEGYAVIPGGMDGVTAYYRSWQTPQMYAQGIESSSLVAEEGEDYVVTCNIHIGENYTKYFAPADLLTIRINENISGWEPVSYKIKWKSSDEIRIYATLSAKKEEYISRDDSIYVLDEKDKDVYYATQGQPLLLVAKPPESGYKFTSWGTNKELSLQPEYSSMTRENAYKQSTLGIYMSPGGTEELSLYANYEETAASKVIDTVGIKGFNMLQGSKYTTAGVTTTGTGYSLSAMTITETSEAGKKVMTTEDSFVCDSDINYCGEFVLTPAAGYSFLSTGGVVNIQGRVNGKKIKSAFTKTVGTTVRLYIICDLGSATYPVTVKNGSIEDEEGNTLTAVSPNQKCIFKASVPSGGQFLRWEFFDEYNGKDDLYSGVTANEDSSFMEDWMRVDDTGDYVDGTLVANAVYKTGNNTISRIELSGVQEPVIGETPNLNKNAASVSPTGVTIENVEWREKSPVDNEEEWGTEMDSSSTFTNAHAYYLTYTIKVPTGKVFDNNLEIIINDKEMEEYEYEDGEVTVTKSFAPLFSDGMWVRDIVSRTYTGKPIKPKVCVFESGNLLTEGKDYTVSYSGNVNAGENTAKARITGKGNYSGSVTKTFTILPASLSDTNSDVTINNLAVLGTKNQRQIFGRPVVKFNGKNVSASEYTVNYVNKDVKTNFAANGTYAIEITGKGKNFKDSRTIFEIVSTNLISHVSVSRIPDQSYTGKSIKPKLVVKDGRKTLTGGSDYILSYDNNIEVGKATVTIWGNGSYKDAKTVSFNIVGTKLSSQNVTMLTKSKEYTGKDIKMTAATDYEVKVGKGDEAKVLVKNVDYSIAYKNNLKTGTATVIFTGMGAYSGTVRKSFRITPASVGKKNNLGIYERNEAIDEIEFPGTAKYQKGGTKLVPGSLKYGEITMVPGKDYTISYRKNTACTNGQKTACAIITGRGCFTGKYEHYYSIEEKSLTKLEAGQYVISGTAKEKQYRNTANNYKTSFTLTDENGRRLSAGTDYDAKNIKYQVLVGDDYVAVEDSSYFNNNRVSLGANGSLSMRIVIGAAGNYTGTRELYYTLYENSVNQIKVSKIAAQQYTGEAICPEPVLTFGKENTLLGMGTDYSLQYVNNTNRGTATIIIQGRGKYGGTKKVTFRISQTKMAWQADN